MIPYTKPFLPPREEYEAYLPGIWDRNWLTNMGPLAIDLENKLADFLRVPQVLYVANGTIGLQLAINALGLSGEIITTPFSFVATTSSIVWQHCKPVFADIDPGTLNVSVDNIEKLITEKTSAILVTHIFGNPCDVYAIGRLADRYGLRVIYDGAHCFGVKIGEASVYTFGDISICSLHATKAYHSVEGGLIISRDQELINKLAFMRNFGFNGPEKFAELGINAKNSEFHAAMGLVNLKHIDELMSKRSAVVKYYDFKLQQVNLQRQAWFPGASRNNEYYPVIFENEASLKTCVQEMNAKDIFPRRYFYPSLTRSLPYVTPVSMPVSDNISPRLLCLPLYPEMTPKEVDEVCSCIQ
ncbi:MAG TPA: DegT/DnrJ/EryC1/StrS family aminotransferase [Puia sp.]